MENLSLKVDSLKHDRTFEDTGHFVIRHSIGNSIPLPKLVDNQQEIIKKIGHLNEMIRNHLEPEIDQIKKQIREMIL